MLTLMLNTLEIANSKYLVTTIDGFERADIRTSQFNYSGADGGLVSDQFYGLRPITITGHIISDLCDDHFEDRMELMGQTKIREDITVKLGSGGNIYQVTGKVTGVSMPISGPRVSDYKIDILCSDPVIYDVTSGSENSISIARMADGGYITPYILPVEWASETPPEVVTNSGTVDIYPDITITGSATNPTIYNVTQGKWIKLATTLGISDEVVINMADKYVLLNGELANNLMTEDSKWWTLEPGDNDILYITDYYGDLAEALLEWYDGYLGV